MKLLLLTNNLDPSNGWGAVASNLAKYLDDYQIETYTSERTKRLCLGHACLKSERYLSRGVACIAYDCLNVLLTRKQKPDLIHCNVEFYAPVAMWLGKRLAVPYTVTAHGTYGALLPAQHRIYRKAFEKAYAVIPVSNYTKKRMLEEGIQANYRVIGNGVDKQKFKPKTEVAKENIVTFVGNLKARKGLRFLMEAMVEVNNQRPDIELVVIGNLHARQKGFTETVQYAKANGINMRFAGKVSEEELVTLYQKAKVNVLPSHSAPFYFEGFGLVHVEANACGTYTIGTRDSGNEDAIAPENGYLVKYGDRAALAKKILEVCSASPYPSIDASKVADWKDIAHRYSALFAEAIKI